jgi:phage tail protein X
MAEDDRPVPGGLPDPTPQIDRPLEQLQSARWLALGKPPMYRIYVTMQGDFWDLIAIRVYGRKRGDEHLMFRLIEANYEHRNISQFPAGLMLCVPDVKVTTEIPLVPWKIATIGPTT